MMERYTPQAQEALGLAVGVAETLNHGYVGTEHLLIGLLQEGTGVAAKVLEENGVELSGLVTFHDGFHYFAQALGLPLLASIEEEEGSEASAMEINEITQLVKEHQLPVIFTEVNGSDATANAISRETGCQVAQLTMLMDGPEEGDLSTYLEGVRSNVNTIVSFFGGEELDQL